MPGLASCAHTVIWSLLSLLNTDRVVKMLCLTQVPLQLIYVSGVQLPVMLKTERLKKL